jgi:hypothetical protein
MWDIYQSVDNQSLVLVNAGSAGPDGHEYQGTTASPNYIEENTPPLPESVTPRQVRLALAQLGMLATVEVIVAQSPDAVKIAWEYATAFKIDDPLLMAMAAQFQIDVKPIFMLASTL